MSAKIEALHGKQNDNVTFIAGDESFELKGRVKWFNTTKGFGFLVPEDGRGDVFFHLSCLRESGHEYVAEGVTLSCQVVHRDKGLQAVKVLDIDTSTAVPFEPSPIQPSNVTKHPALKAAGDLVEVTVKWFDPIKGYGFVTRGENTQDIFIHMETIRNEGFLPVQAGQVLKVRIAESDKGPQVAEIAKPEE